MMEIKNKKTITGIALGAILVGGIFAILPQNAGADLTNLDKIGMIIDILIDINNDLQKKKQFWQRFENITDKVSAVGVFGFCPNVPQTDCAFNVESLAIQNVTAALVSFGADAFIICPDFGCTAVASEGLGFSVLLLTKIGTIGASSFVLVSVDGPPLLVEFNGEKPQDMELTFFTATGEFPDLFDFTCFDGTGSGTTIDCPEDLEETVLEALEK